MFMKFFFNFERVLLATRGCSRNLKTPNSSPLFRPIIHLLSYCIYSIGEQNTHPLGPSVHDDNEVNAKQEEDESNEKSATSTKT